MKKTSMRLVAALGALALVAAACGGGVDFEAGALGAVTVEDGEDIQIRSLNAISGDVAFLGIPNQRGIELAIEDYGAIEGHSVTIGTGLDDLCSADGGQQAANTIVADEQVVGVIGTSCSGAAQAAMPLISDAGMVMISPSNTSSVLTSDLTGTASSDYYAGYYRTAHNDAFQGAAAATFVSETLGLTRVALVHDGDPYTNGLTSAFEENFTEMGGTITVHTAVAKGDVDMGPLLAEIAASDPELLFFPIFPAEGIAILQQAGGTEGMENVVLMGADGLSVQNFMELPESLGMYFSGPNTQFLSNANEATGKTGADFLADYESTYGEVPGADFWAHAYDATTMLLTAIEAVGVVDGDKLHIDRQALRDELSATSNFDGIIGSISCDEFGDCGVPVISIFQHDNLDDILASKTNILYTYDPTG
jgi:branched-chain amino acid transport system substrate-binding protein